MALNDVTATVTTVVGGLVSVLKALIVFFVFANVIYMTGFDPVGGLIDLVRTFMGGGLAGLLTLLVFVSFLK
jgi:RsiW-degrading membrane proteinase PrsW (M82 family)